MKKQQQKSDQPNENVLLLVERATKPKSILKAERKKLPPSKRSRFRSYKKGRKETQTTEENTRGNKKRKRQNANKIGEGWGFEVREEGIRRFEQIRKIIHEEKKVVAEKDENKKDGT